MTPVHVVILGIIQGLTEFLPVSSTAHLYLTSWLLGWDPEGLSFDIALHMGTLLAILLYFHRDWIQIVGQGFGLRIGDDKQLAQNRQLLWLLAVGSIPVGVAGLAFNKQAEGAWRNPYVIASMLIAVGALMWLAERSGRKQRDLSHLSWTDAITIGLAQALAIIPGTSRSGITISAGLFRNLDREAAARYSFLLSTPAIAAAAAKALHDYLKQGKHLDASFYLGIGVSTVAGAAVIAWFMRYLKRRTLKPFVAYRVVFGIIVFALATFVRPAE